MKKNNVFLILMLTILIVGVGSTFAADTDLKTAIDGIATKLLVVINAVGVICFMWFAFQRFFQNDSGAIMKMVMVIIFLILSNGASKVVESYGSKTGMIDGLIDSAP